MLAAFAERLFLYPERAPDLVPVRACVADPPEARVAPLDPRVLGAARAADCVAGRAAVAVVGRGVLLTLVDRFTLAFTLRVGA